MGHLRLELAYDSRTVKKRAAPAGRFRFYHRMVHEPAMPVSFTDIKKGFCFTQNPKNMGHLRLEPNQYNTSRIFSVIYCILERFRLFINGNYRYLQA